MQVLRRIFRRDDTIDLNQTMLDLEETRRLGMKNTASAREAITKIKLEQNRLARLRKLLEKQSGRTSPQEVRQSLRGGGGQFAEMALSRTMQTSDTKAMNETQLEAIEQREQAVHDLWMDLERFIRS